MILSMSVCYQIDLVTLGGLRMNLKRKLCFPIHFFVFILLTPLLLFQNCGPAQLMPRSYQSGSIAERKVNNMNIQLENAQSTFFDENSPVIISADTNTLDKAQYYEWIVYKKWSPKQDIPCDLDQNGTCEFTMTRELDGAKVYSVAHFADGSQQTSQFMKIQLSSSDTQLGLSTNSQHIYFTSGEEASIEVAVSGGDSTTQLQWMKKNKEGQFENIFGEKSSSLNFYQVTPFSSGVYKLVATKGDQIQEISIIVDVNTPDVPAPLINKSKSTPTFIRANSNKPLSLTVRFQAESQGPYYYKIFKDGALIKESPNRKYEYGLSEIFFYLPQFSYNTDSGTYDIQIANLSGVNSYQIIVNTRTAPTPKDPNDTSNSGDNSSGSNDLSSGDSNNNSSGNSHGINISGNNANISSNTGGTTSSSNNTSNGSTTSYKQIKITQRLNENYTKLIGESISFQIEIENINASVKFRWKVNGNTIASCENKKVCTLNNLSFSNIGMYSAEAYSDEPQVYGDITYANLNVDFKIKVGQDLSSKNIYYHNNNENSWSFRTGQENSSLNGPLTYDPIQFHFEVYGGLAPYTFNIIQTKSYINQIGQVVLRGTGDRVIKQFTRISSRSIDYTISPRVNFSDEYFNNGWGQELTGWGEYYIQVTDAIGQSVRSQTVLMKFCNPYKNLNPQNYCD